MKIVYLALLITLFTACGQSTDSTSSETGKAVQDLSKLDKYLGTWYAQDKPEEVITIAKCKNFDSANVCLVNDGKTEIAFPYNIKEDKFRLHQPEYWVELIHDAASNQLHWKVIHFDETDGKVVRKYVLKES